VTKKIFTVALLPSLALLAACTATPPPAVAPPPEEAFRGVCEQRFPSPPATPFAVSKCMFEELDRSRGVTPASATPAPEPAPAPSTPARRR
jgi:hypothetical protein